MIVTEYLSDRLICHRSNENKMIRQIETGNIYIEAIDVSPCNFTYEETDVEIEPIPEID